MRLTIGYPLVRRKSPSASGSVTIQPESTPHYLRATLATVVGVAIVPITFLAFAYLDYQSPNWDPDGDSGAVQGFMIIFLAALLAISYAATAFPVAARRLHRLKKLRAVPFIRQLAAWLLLASALLAMAGSLLVGSLALMLPLTVILFFLVAALCLPFGLFWLWLAK